MPIKVLNKDIIEKIAAGEVVERPSSVVKELIENAIDAGSSSITVEIENGGISYIRVTDNGKGMSEADAKICFLAHATSKISSSPDLFHISTLGFRGEALSSISAVSKVTLFTRTKDVDYATKIVNHGGSIISCEPCGKPEGTTIVVEDLFYNVPARLKFLKKPSSETSYISAIIQKYILARPDISFRFISAGKDVYFSKGDKSLKNAIYSVYGQEVYENLIEVEYTYDYIKISGFIGEPAIARGTKSFQNLFVNGRYIRSDVVSNSVKQGYLNRVMPAKHPVFILNLAVPFDSVDVNVHPNKLDVRFKDEGLIGECFFKAVNSAFNFEIKQAEIREVDNEAFEGLISRSDNSFQSKQEQNKQVKQSLIDAVNAGMDKYEDSPLINKNPIAKQSANLLNQDEEEALSTLENANCDNSATVYVQSNTKEVTGKQDTQTSLQLDLFEGIGDFCIIGQLFNTYILIEYRDSLLLIDQHAAHERINTDILLRQFEDRNVLKQRLLLPKTIQLTAEDFIEVMECQGDFDEAGFEIEEFGSNIIRVNAVPHIFGEENSEQFFFETLDAIRKNPKMDTRKHTIFQMACKHSIKAGQALTNDEIKDIITRSFKNNSPLNCPHGRPIVIIKTKKEIEKWFMRIV